MFSNCNVNLEMGIQNGLNLSRMKPRMASTYSKPKPGEEIVITGMSGKFPDSDNVYHFRDNLFNKVDLVSGDYRRWKPIHPEVPQRTGKMFGIDKFDAGFFGVPQRHADSMDPMIRMLHECVYEALLDAGHHPFDLVGTNTGVYDGTCFSETEKSAFYNNLTRCDSITGCQRSMVAKRINYFFGFDGAAFISDTACSSSLFALEHAYRHLKGGVCEKAIVCGTQLCLHPIVSLQFARLGVLSPDGSCKSFDDAGNGYARSEAVTAIVLEKSKDAKRVYAEIIHSKTNCDGYKEQGITFPSSNMQKVLMKEFYEECKVDPSTLTFVEAHGTGTKVGDPEELVTLDEIFCKRRNKPLHIGTIKSNIGHNEPVSGLCSIVKVLIGFESGFIPPNINYFTPRKGVEALEKGRLVVVTDKTPWPDQSGLVGVNSFGFGGGNGHVLLRWNPKVKVNEGIPKDNLPRLVCASGRTETTVSSIFDHASKMDAEYIKLIHQVFRRVIPNQLYNGYMITSKRGEVERVICDNRSIGNKLRIVFGDVDGEWFRLCGKLMEIPMFSGAIQKIYEIMAKETNINVLGVLESKTGKIIDSTFGTIVVELTLADIIRELNLDIHEIIGVGYGELAAAYLDGYLSLKEALLTTHYVSSGNVGKIKDIFTKKVLRPNKWLPIYNVDKYANFYPQGSLDYFTQNTSNPTNFRDVTKSTDTVSLIVGSPIENLLEKEILLVGNYGSDPVMELLRSLGRTFLSGFPSHLDNLFPNVFYPVSRGTPMLSPMIKWDHSKNYTVHLYKNEEERKSGQRVMHISVRLEDWIFMTGHVIDGRNLFPAAGYLALVWESYAIILGKLMTDTGMVFEDVKYLRAATVPPEATLSLRVIIQLENKLFEIVEGDAVLVTGTVYPLEEGEGKSVQPPTIFNDEDAMVMYERDVYKELRLRGYHYSNQFRAIKKFTPEMNRAVITWSGNWITFMDNMFQVQILGENTRSLYVPTSIKRVVIDGPRHINHTVGCNNQVPVTYHKDMAIISGGGIEIVGLGASVIPRRKAAEPVLETYKFIPYHGRLEHDQAVRCMVQTIMENTNTIKVKSVEVLENDEDEEPIMPLVQKTLGDLPLIQSELKILSPKENLDLPGIVIEDKSLNTETGCLILTGRDILRSPELLSMSLRVTRDVSGFIITKGSPCEVPPQAQVVSSYETERGNLLLVKETSRYIEKVPVPIPFMDDLSWVQQLQGLTNKKAVLYSQNDPNNGLLGLVNCLRREPFGSNISAVLIIDDSAPPFDIEVALYKSQLEKNLAINVFKGGNWGSYRHLLLPGVKAVEPEHCYVNVTTRGDLSSLRWIEGPLSTKTPPEPEKELLRVHYAAINFRDIMTASGRLTVDAITRDRVQQECIQGFEFSGTLTGDPSKRVMGMTVSGALSTMVIADSKTLYPFPDHWSLEEAATVPVVYGTVLYAFIMRGRMRRGQSVLIHSGTGGVGQAAINIASHLGCTIFVTVGTEEKRAFLKRHFPQIKEEHIGNSRSISFEQMVLERTGGRGVDFVLNSLAEEKLLASVRCLAYNGTFLEIGKFDLANDNQLATALLGKQARYEGIMLDQLFIGEDGKKEILAELIKEGVLNGSIIPLIRTVFSSDKIEEAFRFMATGKHVGKVLIKVRGEEQNGNTQLFKGIPRLSCNRSACYVILGGLGGFGLELADWLVTRGAKTLVLSSRTGVKNGYQAYRLNTFKAYGVRVFIRKDDVSSEEGCTSLLTFAEDLRPVEAIFNLAVVLKDALFENQTVETFKTSLTPKACATRHLDVASRKICPNLRYFVVFSSVSCGRGNAGQTNYGMANSVMERVCEKRKSEGYPALAIQWGAVGEVGLVADMQEDHKELVIGGTLQQRISNCLDVLDRLLRQEDPVVSSMVVAEKKTGSGVNNIFDAVLNIIGVTNLKAVSHHATFPELGMDSMMAVEIKQTLEREYDVFMTAQDIRSMTIARLKDFVMDQTETVTKPVQSEFEGALPEDIKLLFRHIGDEESSNNPSVQISTTRGISDDASPIFAFAGIEGMAGIYESVGKRLSANLTCLQFCTENHSESIEEIAAPFVKVVEASTPDNFTIVAYSFGCVVATELMYSLESLGKVGKAFFIDGAPDLMTRLAKMYFPFYDDEVFQTTLLCVLMTRYMPFDAILNYKPDIVKRKSYEDKIRYVLSVSPTVTHSEKYVIEMCKAGLSRLKAVRKYEPRAEKLNSRITLAKPTRLSLVEIADDYNLSSITKHPVEVKVIEGNHVSILENKRLAKEIQTFLQIEKPVQKVPLRNSVEMFPTVETKTI